jgi:hypothetical protein
MRHRWSLHAHPPVALIVLFLPRNTTTFYRSGVPGPARSRKPHRADAMSTPRGAPFVSHVRDWHGPTKMLPHIPICVTVLRWS